MLDTTLLNLLSYSPDSSSQSHTFPIPHLPLGYFLQKAENFQFHSVSMNKKTPTYDMLCEICMTSSSRSNPLYACACCGVSVHSNCYGGELRIKTPVHEWICERCLHVLGRDLAPDSVRCRICKECKGSLVKMDGDWIHVVCVLWSKHARFVDRGRRKGKIREGKEETCSYCLRNSKYVARCDKSECEKKFHAKCAQMNGVRPVYMVNEEMKKGIMKIYCREHRADICAVDFSESKVRMSYVSEFNVQIKQEAKSTKYKKSQAKTAPAIQEITSSDDDTTKLVIRAPKSMLTPIKEEAISTEIFQEPVEAEVVQEVRIEQDIKVAPNKKRYNPKTAYYVECPDNEPDTVIVETSEYIKAKKAESKLLRSKSKNIDMNSNTMNGGSDKERDSSQDDKRKAMKTYQYEENEDGQKILVYYNRPELIEIIDSTESTKSSSDSRQKLRRTSNRKAKLENKSKKRPYKKKKDPAITPIKITSALPSSSSDIALSPTLPPSTPIPSDSLPLKRFKPFRNSSKEPIAYRTLDDSLRSITGIDSITSMDKLDKLFKRYLRLHAKTEINHYDISNLPELSSYLKRTQIQHSETKNIIFQFSRLHPSKAKVSTSQTYSDEPGTVKKLKIDDGIQQSMKNLIINS